MPLLRATQLAQLFGDGIARKVEYVSRRSFSQAFHDEFCRLLVEFHKRQSVTNACLKSHQATRPRYTGMLKPLG
jgi:hypothetical protein